MKYISRDESEKGLSASLLIYIWNFFALTPRYISLIFLQAQFHIIKNKIIHFYCFSNFTHDLYTFKELKSFALCHLTFLIMYLIQDEVTKFKTEILSFFYTFEIWCYNGLCEDVQVN